MVEFPASTDINQIKNLLIKTVLNDAKKLADRLFQSGKSKKTEANFYIDNNFCQAPSELKTSTI